MRPMLPTLTFDVPEEKEWLFEAKYDGFRGILHWDKEPRLTSRNDKPLLNLFPEINAFLEQHKDKFEQYLPLILDGEVVLLENAYKAHFGSIQVRGE